jgi:pyrimidine deaminase RibD-like protein
MNSSEDLVDAHLKIVINYLLENWLETSVGLVAAGIFDPEKEPVIATSVSPESGMWLHAERNAMNIFERQYGTSPGPNTIIATTLSPCTIELRSRIGASCTDLLEKNDLHRVHSGVLDSLQPESIEIYRRLNIKFTITSDPYCSVVCKNLLRIFEEYGNRVNYELPIIKRRINVGRLLLP